jgi:hypothetical protein
VPVAGASFLPPHEMQTNANRATRPNRIMGASYRFCRSWVTARGGGYGEMTAPPVIAASISSRSVVSSN